MSHLTELQVFDALERCGYLESEAESICGELVDVQSKLMEMKKALSDALACECALKDQLDAVRVQLSGRVQSSLPQPHPLPHVKFLLLCLPH